MKYTLQSSFITACATFCMFSVIASQAMADQDSFRSYNSTIWGSLGANFFAYKEPSSPPDLSDSERDAISSIAGGASLMGGNANLYFALAGNVSYGDAHYNGAYLYNPTTPYEGTTKETISTIDGKIGKGFLLDDSVMFIPYLELGYRYWDRNLGGGQDEDYQNFDVLGGAMLQAALTEDVIVSIYGSAGTTFSPQASTSGDTYNLGSDAMYKVGGKIGYMYSERTEFFTTLDFDHFSYGQSSVQADNTYEPSSNTDETAVRVGVAYHFR